MQDYSSILNEIGEYFGRYQKADGSYDLFTNVVNNGNVEPQRIQNVSDLKKEIPFFIEFYDKPIFNVSGVIAAKLEKLLLISFFKMDENNRENY